MKPTYRVFNEVQPFYMALTAGLESAQEIISMMYFTFDHGEWSQKIGTILKEKAAGGVQVRLMVDTLGLLMDNVPHALSNLRLMRELRNAGIEVTLFQPAGPDLNMGNRLHMKACGIDQTLAFVGGSNIGDYYLDWQDTNLGLEGELGQGIHELFDYVRKFSRGEGPAPTSVPDFSVGDIPLRLTVPGQRQAIREEILNLIRNAQSSIFIRNWYFLPDDEIIQALMDQAQKGVKVNILHSHKSRTPLIDAANYRSGHKLVQAGVRIYRYTPRFMHAKVAWNDRGEVILGSANLDAQALTSNFECCLDLQEPSLALQMQQAFWADSQESIVQTRHTLPQRPFAKQTLTYLCSLASDWL